MDLTELKRYDKKSGKRHPWESARAKIIGFLIKDISSIQHIADVGSGDAYVLQFLQAGNYAKKYTAIDTAYTENIIDGLKERGAQNIDFKYKITKSGAAADIVLLLDVLEHCSDDAEVLRETIGNTLSSKEAKLIITVPAIKMLFSRHDELLGHYRRYNRKQLVSLCERHHLKVIQSGYFFFTLLPLRIVIKLAEKLGLKKTTRSIDNWTKGKLLTNFISLILWFDFRVCHSLSSAGINIPGLSSYCVCQKPLS